jgi:hypothetical protein
MRRDRRLSSPRNELVEPIWTIQDADWRHANCGTTSIVLFGDPSRVSGLMKFPQRPKAWMDALLTCEHFASDTRVPHTAILENCPGNCDRSLSVVGGLADSPFAFRVPEVARDSRSRWTFKSLHAARIPLEKLLAREILGLLADGIACRKSLQASENPLRNSSAHLGCPSSAKAYQQSGYPRSEWP